MKTLHCDVYINLQLLESFLSGLSDLHNCVGKIILTLFEKQKYCLHCFFYHCNNKLLHWGRNRAGYWGSLLNVVLWYFPIQSNLPSQTSRYTLNLKKNFNKIHIFIESPEHK